MTLGLRQPRVKAKFRVRVLIKAWDLIFTLRLSSLTEDT